VQSGDYNITAEHAWVAADANSFPLPRTRGAALGARLSQNYRIVRAEGQFGPWKVKTTAYHYTLEEPEGREIISYQWHPTGRGALPYPHLHLGTASEVGCVELREHIPTGRVSLEQFLRFAIEAFHVRIRRQDWRDVL